MGPIITFTSYSVPSKLFKISIKAFYYEGYCLEEVCFVGSRENERLLVKCDDCYIIDPQNLSDKHIFHSELFDIDNIYNYNYVIELRGQHLWINNLAQNKEWCDFLNKKPKKYNKINAHSCGKDILKIIQCTLERYKRNSNEVNYDKPYRGKLYIWDINESEDYLTITAYKDEKQMENLIISKLDDYGEPFVEFKLLESDDLIMISSFGIYIWTIKSSCLITLLYFWFNVDIYQNCAQKTAKQALIDQLMFLTKSFGSKNIPPSPYFDQLIRHSKRLIYKRKVEKTKVKFSEGEKTKVKFSGLLEDYMNDATILKLYGKELIQVLLDKNQSEQIKVVFNNFLNQCLLQPLYDNDIYTFIKSADIITYMLLKLELFDKNFRFIDRFLSKTALLIPDAYKSSIDNYSALSHLEHCGIYVHLPYLQKISPFDYIFFWISDIWKFLKEKSQIYKFSKFPYIVYSSYFTSPKKTIKLIVPLLNFATYPEKEYFDYNELIYLSDNIFTSLNTPEYYKWWNIKALVKFKWATYGKYYYFAIWTIYSIFMTCFVVVATIPPSKISWSSQAILLVITVILGVFHFTFEVRQFVHGPKSYIASPWNWFDLSAVLFPTITSLIWLLDKPPSMWVLTVSSLLLELKFLMFLRALEYFGTYFAIMIGVAQQVFSFLIVLGVIILAFSHSLHLLLRPTTEYSYDKPSYTDDPNNPWNLVARYQSILPGGVIGESSLITTPDENTNLFAVLDTAIIAVYFILTGDSSAVSPWVLRKNWTLVILLIMFSFFTTIYLMNLFIGLLGMAIDATNNEESFLKLRGEILSEIELFWMLPYQRRKKNWFPQILFYEASIDELKKYVKSVKDEDYDDVSQPYLSSAILNITECGSNLEEKINERFDVMSKEFKNLVEQIAELTRSINNEKNKNEEK
ncbi:transient receptor potential cation channel subfamily a member 1-like [Gigaspora margarita]|nr:transient receptor potential cation channel subfamily a member 1-like [Gigaspora margarita]